MSILSGDEIYPDEVTSGLLEDDVEYDGDVEDDEDVEDVEDVEDDEE